MAATATAPPPLSPQRVGAVDHEDSNVSSPLSDVDDKEDDDDDIEHMQLDHDDEEHSSSIEDHTKEATHTASDSDSALSDAHSDANDTEAETERLFDTPRHGRHRDVVVDQYNEGQVFEHTPSKLRRTATVDDADLHDHDDHGLATGDDASAVSSPAALVESPTKPATTKETSVDENTRNSQERKRKRSPIVSQLELEQPLRKRTSSLEKHEADTPLPDEDTVMVETDATPADQSPIHSGVEEDPPGSPVKQQVEVVTQSIERAVRPPKKNTRGSRRKTIEAEIEGSNELQNGTNIDETDEADHHEGPEGDAEEEHDAVTAHDEELEKKHAAFKDWSHIEEMFGVFRDRLYKDRLQRLEEEEQSLLTNVPNHPEYLNMKQCLDDRLDQKLRDINKELEYRMKALEKRTVAQRAQIWGQYFQGVREKREKALETLNREWYEVQSARRNAHKGGDWGIVFPKDPAQRLRNAIAYNTEVATLASIAKYEGFPACPEIKGLSSLELEDDLEIIERAKRGRQKPLAQPRDDFHTPTFNRLGPAGEQFLKDTPWANPNHSAHRVQQHQIPQPLDWRVDQIAGRTGRDGPVPSADIRATLDGTSSSRPSPSLSNRLTESPELTRPILNPAHHPMKRAGNLSSGGRGSKTAAA